MSFTTGLLLLAAASPLWPFVNLVARPSVASTFPRILITFSMLVIACMTGLALIAWQLPALLPAAAGAGVLVSAGLWWRGRVSYGSSRGLPPGSLAILPVKPWVDHWHFIDLARTYGPVFKVSHFFHPMVCISNLESGLALLKAHDDVRLRSPKVAADRFLPCGFMRGMDPDHHKTYRKVLQAVMTPRVVAAWERAIADEVRQALHDLMQAGAPVYAKPAWDRMIQRAFARLFFGIEAGTPAFRQLTDACAVIAQVSARRISVPWLPSERRTRRVLDDIVQLMRQHKAPDCFLDELRRQPDHADSEQMILMLVFAMHLGASDLAGMLQWLTKMACAFPAQFDQLRATLASGNPEEGNAALRRYTLETLRLHQVEHLYRRVLEDIDWEGFRIPKGWLLRICLAESHRSPAVFDEPQQFNPDRMQDRPPAQHQFLPFGAFRRSCLGDGVAYALAGQFLRVLTNEWSVRQIGESHEDYHAWHWTPGSDFRIQLAPRSPA